ncbi:MAG: GNAT family N-acetyltransferase [Armatimonadia bacterium]|nr:GNAT family N-acetyltransferase [Armatimonadia bacterium]
MTSPSAEEIRTHLLARFAPSLKARGLSLDTVPDDYDLLVEGIIDSLGLLEMISDVEERFGLDLDFEKLDAESLTIVGPFCRFVAAEATRLPGASAESRITVTSSVPDAERHISEILPWILEAASPYYEWFFGGNDEATRVLGGWMRRPSSEIYVGRASLIFEADHVVGGFLALGGAELRAARKADTLAALSDTTPEEAVVRKERMEATGDLFVTVADDEFYLSKMGVAREHRGAGLGRRLLAAYLEAGRQGGFAKFRLDVWAENRAAIRLYESNGFRVATRSVAEEAGMTYLSMIREQV